MQGGATFLPFGHPTLSSLNLCMYSFTPKTELFYLKSFVEKGVNKEIL